MARTRQQTPIGEKDFWVGPMTNIELSERIVRTLLSAGVSDFCLCAGARNSPIIEIFNSNPDLKVFHFFDERAASFFALGRIASTRRPVAVITTSGTAAAECLAAAVEGTYSSLPLILVTADRPKSYRGTGAPQAINQVGLFSYYIEATFDLDHENSHLSLNGLTWKKPIHINVCFKEPLIDGPVPKIDLPKKFERTRFPESIPLDMVDKLGDFLELHRPLVIASTIPEKLQAPVVQFLEKLRAPIYAETISGLRGRPELKGLLLRSGEKMISKMVNEGHCNAILRLGGVPTTRFWRDLESKYPELPVFSIGYNHFTGLSREIPHYEDLEDLGRLRALPVQKEDPAWREKDDRLSASLEALFAEFPASEPALLRQLALQTRGHSVYVGNSLPIREWDLVVPIDVGSLRTVANRGANGIDGQISTFMGWSNAKAPNWCIIGDLTAMYDLTALWVTPQIAAPHQFIVIVNNGGGMIFDRMFGGKDIFLNRHGIEFSAWAKMWNWAYTRLTSISPDLKLESRHIVELRPDPNQSAAFWRAYDSLWI